MAAAALNRSDERTAALRDVVAEVIVLDGPRIQLGGRMSGLSLHYDLGEGHPLLGRRMPDLDLVTGAGTVRVFALLQRARPVLIELGGEGFDLAPWADRVQLARGSYDGVWQLPVLGPVSAPTAVLVRPDGHVAWVGEGTSEGLADVLATWFGPAAV